MQINLPEVGGDYLGWGGDAVDDFSAQDDLHIFLVPVLGNDGLDDVHLTGLGEELTGSDGSSARDASGDDGELAGIGVAEAGDDGVVAVVVGGLLDFAIDAPTLLGVRLGVLDPEVGHVGIIAEAVAEIAGHAQGPGVIEGAEENSWALAEVGEGGGVFAEESVVAVAHLEEAGDAHEGLEVVEDDAAHVLVEVTDLGGGGGVEEGLAGEHALGKAEGDGVVGAEDGGPEFVERGGAGGEPECAAGYGRDEEYRCQDPPTGADRRMGDERLGGGLVRGGGEAVERVGDGRRDGGVGPLEVGDVGAGREGDAELVGAVGVLVVLGDALADLGGGDTDDGVGGGVVAGVAAEDFDAEGAFLELIAAAFELLLNDVAEEAGEAFAVGEVGVVEEAIQLPQDVCLLRIAVNGCRNSSVVGHDFSVFFIREGGL